MNLGGQMARVLQRNGEIVTVRIYIPRRPAAPAARASVVSYIS